jgi:hypothetical protein
MEDFNMVTKDLEETGLQMVEKIQQHEDLYEMVKNSFRRATVSPIGSMTVGPTDARDIVAQIVLIEKGEHPIEYYKDQAEKDILTRRA